MLRSILGVILGGVAGVATIALTEAVGHLVYPPPAGIDLAKPEDLKNLMSVIPLGAKIAVLIAWALGTFVGAATAIFVSERRSVPAWIVALILFGAALYTMTIIPHPEWMLIGATIATLVCSILPAYIWARS